MDINWRSELGQSTPRILACFQEAREGPAIYWGGPQKIEECHQHLSIY